VFVWLKNFLDKKRTIPTKLDFVVDLDTQGKSTVETFININGNKERVNNIQEIWDYGSTLKIGTRKYIIALESLEILSSVKSLNPTVTEDGRLIFDVCPPILRYLRTKKTSVDESEKSKNEVKISDKQLKPHACIDYLPGKGLVVETGFQAEVTQQLISKDKINVTPDGNFAKVDNVFYPLPELTKDVKKWIDKKKIRVSLDDIPEFFKRDLVLLKTKLGAVLTEKASAIRIIDAPFTTKISINKDEPGWLDFKVGYVTGDYEVPAEIIRIAKDKYVHPEENIWLQVDTNTINTTERYLQELGAIKTAEGFRVPISQFFSLEDFIEKIGGIKQVTAEYQQFLDEITDFCASTEFKLDENLESHLISKEIVLRPYQRAGIHWLSWLSKHHLHGVLADDMGLGKTIQSVTTIRTFYEKEGFAGHSLIVCPKSIVHFWSREIKRVFPGAYICEYIGTWRDRSLFDKTTPIIFVTTYDTTVRDMEYIHKVPFYFVVLDEATKIKNPNAMRTRAIKEINAVHRIALTGTPIENRPAELWSLFDFLIKGHLGSYGQFVRLFENTINSGDDNVAKNLSNRIRPFILRRLKKDVAKDLPEKIDMDEWCELTDEQKFLYNEIQDRYVSPVRDALRKGEFVNFTTNILPILTKLKQVCDHPALINGKVEPIENRSEKFDIVVDKVKEIHDSGERVVIFSHFLATLDLLEMALKSCGLKYIRIDGSTQNRQGYVDRFNEKQVDAALCSIQACGHGITLTAANHVIHIDRWWNPAIEDQATDRVHRIGQEKNVYVYRVIAKGTLEEKIALLLEKKRNISDKVIGAATREEMKWTKEELLEILKPLKS